MEFEIVRRMTRKIDTFRKHEAWELETKGFASAVRWQERRVWIKLEKTKNAHRKARIKSIYIGKEVLCRFIGNFFPKSVYLYFSKNKSPYILYSWVQLGLVKPNFHWAMFVDAAAFTGTICLGKLHSS